MSGSAKSVYPRLIIREIVVSRYNMTELDQMIDGFNPS